MFLEPIGIMVLTLPLMIPLIETYGFDLIWFWLLMLLNVTVGGITPPFGYTIFAFKGAAKDVPLGDVFAATWPFVGLFLIGMVIIAAFPSLATWLPAML